jgi:hypothetical protein
VLSVAPEAIHAWSKGVSTTRPRATPKSESSTTTAKATRAVQVAFHSLEDAQAFADNKHLTILGHRRQITPPGVAPKEILANQKSRTAWLQGLPPGLNDSTLEAHLGSDVRLTHFSMLRTPSGATIRKALLVFVSAEQREEMMKHGDSWVIRGKRCTVTAPAAKICYCCHKIGHNAEKCPPFRPGSPEHILALQKMEIPTFSIPPCPLPEANTRPSMERGAKPPLATQATPPQTNPWAKHSTKEHNRPAERHVLIAGNGKNAAEGSKTGKPPTTVSLLPQTARGRSSERGRTMRPEGALATHKMGTSRALKELHNLAVDAGIRGAHDVARMYSKQFHEILELQERIKQTFSSHDLPQSSMKPPIRSRSRYKTNAPVQEQLTPKQSQTGGHTPSPLSKTRSAPSQARPVQQSPATLASPTPAATQGSTTPAVQHTPRTLQVTGTAEGPRGSKRPRRTQEGEPAAATQVIVSPAPFTAKEFIRISPGSPPCADAAMEEAAESSGQQTAEHYQENHDLQQE